MFLTLGLPKLLDETHGLALETTVEPAAGAGVDEVTELLRAEVEEPVSHNQNTAINCLEPPAQGAIASVGKRTGQGRHRGKRTCGTPSSP